MYSQLRRFIGLHVGWDQLWQYALLKTKRKKIFSLHFVWSTTLPWNSTVLLDAESQKICVRPISAMANFCFYVLKSVVTFIVLPCLFWIDGNNKAWDENYTIAFIKDFIPVDTLAMLPLMTSKWQSMTYVLSVTHENPINNISNTDHLTSYKRFMMTRWTANLVDKDCREVRLISESAKQSFREARNAIISLMETSCWTCGHWPPSLSFGKIAEKEFQERS
jgi:hypothetical protein